MATVSKSERGDRLHNWRKNRGGGGDDAGGNGTEADGKNGTVRAGYLHKHWGKGKGKGLGHGPVRNWWIARHNRTKNPNCVCPLVVKYVCGSDNTTYENECELKCEQGIEKAHDGSCEDPTQHTPHPLHSKAGRNHRRRSRINKIRNFKNKGQPDAKDPKPKEGNQDVQKPEDDSGSDSDEGPDTEVDGATEKPEPTE